MSTVLPSSRSTHGDYALAAEPIGDYIGANETELLPSLPFHHNPLLGILPPTQGKVTPTSSLQSNPLAPSLAQQQYENSVIPAGTDGITRRQD